MKKLLYLFLVVSFIFTACKKEEGCTDAIATNYNADAEENDGSCIYSIVGDWDCTTMTIDSTINFSYMGITIDSLSSSGSSSTTAAEEEFYGLSFAGGPTSGNVYIYEEPITITDTSTWAIVGDSLVIDEGEMTFKHMVTSNALSLSVGMSMHQDDGMGMVVDYTYNQTINFTRNNGFTTSSTNQRKSNTPWFYKVKLMNSIKKR
ncbi:hypothetical protein OAJ65_00635 [Flavobacteriales bacterium]|nr:hypothetical protein [Flavobacteriales bacterium]